MKRCLLLAAALACLPASAGAATPIPGDPAAGGIRTFEGRRAKARRLAAPEPPRHPFMAPSGRSNLHNDGY